VASLRSKLDAAGLGHSGTRGFEHEAAQVFLEDPGGINVELDSFEHEQKAA